MHWLVGFNNNNNNLQVYSSQNRKLHQKHYFEKALCPNLTTFQNTRIFTKPPENVRIRNTAHGNICEGGNIFLALFFSDFSEETLD